MTTLLKGSSLFQIINGSQSSELEVTSGIPPPQGSVLGPLLFLNGVSCIALNWKLLIYADDVALYQIIHFPSDYLLVQNDINAISVWTNKNFLYLNTNKCCYMLFSKKFHPCQLITKLVIEGQSLRRVTTFKYLGVLFSHDGSWSPHITNVCNKARKVLGLLYRKYYHDSHPDTLLHLYKILVHPLLEYATCVWDPYLRKDINNIEKVQAFALKICLNEWHVYYDTFVHYLTYCCFCNNYNKFQNSTC